MAQSQLSKKIAKQFELIATSVHEAGHTIFALLCKMRVPSVKIFFNKKTKRVEGCCNYEMPDYDIIKNKNLCKTLIEYEIGIKYAGLTAEKYHFKTLSGSDKFPLFLRDGSSDDTSAASLLIRQYKIVPVSKKIIEYKKKKINQISDILQEYWDDVILISHCLFSQKTLSFSTLKKVLTKKSKNKIFWKTQFKLIGRIFTKFGVVDEKYLRSIILSS